MTIYAYDTVTKQNFPRHTFFWYSVREAKRLYCEKFGLRYRRGIVFYRDFGGVRIERMG